MFAYAMLGTTDLERAARFYDALMAELGQERCFADDTVIGWGGQEDYDRPNLCVGLPFDGRPASVGNGTMIALKAPSPDLVRRLHAKALAHGGTDEGAPGLRPQYSPGFYIAYVRDPDGNKLAFACYGAEDAA
ncbi:VOC family protein [Marinivivus vitaminiproducens]|uniref:VOC family protein n=1 Tax=Marinivivus vitaminiproducens TaxID=3035935 RepID=UPI00279EDECC|nr:VOC family protein [Geminicoccaceae bacterium SCSIO 64248]